MNSTIKRFSKKSGSPPRPGPALGCGGSVVVGVRLVGACLVAVLFRFRKINLKMESGKNFGKLFWGVFGVLKFFGKFEPKLVGVFCVGK